MIIIVPIAETREVSVGAALAIVLGRGLAVHLKHAATRTTDHPAHEIDVVYLDCGRGCLHRLIDTLEAGAQQCRGFADHFCRATQIGGRDSGNAFDGLWRIARHGFCKLVEADRAAIDEAHVESGRILNEQVKNSIQQGHIGAEPRREV